MAEEVKLTNPELIMLVNDKEDGFNYRKRREEDWRENYTLGRDKVQTNRLEQRQSVNVPLMKTTTLTVLKDVDDMPVIYFENLDNNKDAEIFQNEYWKKTMEMNKSEVQDIVDKRQVIHFGRAFDQWQIVDGKIKWTVQDTEDILVSRFTDPWNINSSRFLIHTHIFEPLSRLSLNKDYDQEAILNLKKFYSTQQGLIKAADNLNTLQAKNQKMADMGVPDLESPILGETYCELSLHFRWLDNEKDSKGNLMPPQIFLFVQADDQQILMKKPQEEVIGVTKDHWWRDHYAYHSWAIEVDRQDVWTDGIADVVRTPNKILNAWFSQLVENRTLRNFGMKFYDATKEGFSPGSYQPVPFGWYGVPGKPSDVMQSVEIPDLSESLDEMTFLIDMVNRATGASLTQQGELPQRQLALGIIQLSLGEAKERAKGMSKFNIPVWKERAMTFLKLIEAGENKLDDVKIYKKGRNTDHIYSQEIGPKDWMTKSGYGVKIWNQDEKLTNDTNRLQKQNAVKQVMPDNPKVDEVYKRNLLDFAEYTPEDINDVMMYESQKNKAPMVDAMGNPINPGQPGMVNGGQPNRMAIQPGQMPPQPVA